MKGGIKGETLDDDDNSDEGDDEDYTVYECHGLAPVRLHWQCYIVTYMHSDKRIKPSTVKYFFLKLKDYPWKEIQCIIVKITFLKLGSFVTGIGLNL